MSIKKVKEQPKKAKATRSVKSILNNPEIEVNTGGNNARTKRIENCETCNGNPQITDFKIPGFSGKKCEICYEVVSHEKI
jgi:hypothetical protein